MKYKTCCNFNNVPQGGTNVNCLGYQEVNAWFSIAKSHKFFILELSFLELEGSVLLCRNLTR